MDGGPTIYTTPRYITQQSARLRWAAWAHALLAPVAIWLPILVGVRRGRAALIGLALFVVMAALLQLVPLAAPRTMRRRFRRLTGQVSLAAFVVFLLLALLSIVHDGLRLLALATVALDALVVVYLLVSLPVTLAPHPEDIPRP
jgi:hypothetical protein